MRWWSRIKGTSAIVQRKVKVAAMSSEQTAVASLMPAGIDTRFTTPVRS
jgi:hypothetical protein